MPPKATLPSPLGTAAVVEKKLVGFAASIRGQKILRVTRIVLFAAVIAYLIYELRDVRWNDVIDGLPLNPLFYLLLLALYCLLPLSQLLAYRITWSFDTRASLSAFVRKRIFNKDVLGYSGEVYFYGWARRNVQGSDREILKTIRDQNIVSSAASTSVALLLLAIFLYTGQLSLTDVVGTSTTGVFVTAAVVIVLSAIVILRLRKYLFAMAARTAGTVFAVHVMRLVVGQLLQIAMWSVAMPDVSLQVWFTYAALSIIVTRIPFVPNMDLVFMSIAISLSGVMGLPEAGLFALFASIAVANRLLNLVAFSSLSFVTGPVPGRLRLRRSRGRA